MERNELVDMMSKQSLKIGAATVSIFLLSILGLSQHLQAVFVLSQDAKHVFDVGRGVIKVFSVDARSVMTALIIVKLRIVEVAVVQYHWNFRARLRVLHNLVCDFKKICLTDGVELRRLLELIS